MTATLLPPPPAAGPAAPPRTAEPSPREAGRTAPTVTLESEGMVVIEPGRLLAGPVRVGGPRGVVTVPRAAATVPGFRKWTTSEDFPEIGRVDLVGGRIYVDLSMQRQQAHGLPKTEIVRVLANRNVVSQFGELTSDVTRVFLPVGETSCEPDVVLVSYEALESGRVTETPGADGDDGVELVGPPELVVEVVSPSSVTKDTRQLPAGYFVGGVTEYWLVDCRDDDAAEVGFTIHARGGGTFEPVAADADGFAASGVLGKSYRLTRERARLGRWLYRLEER